MSFGSSTFKSSSLTNNQSVNNISVIVEDLNSQTSTFGTKSRSRECVEYEGFLEEMNEMRDKVRKGDLSDFKEY